MVASDVTVSARRGQPVDRAIEVAVSCSQACEAEGKGKLFLFLREGARAARASALIPCGSFASARARFPSRRARPLLLSLKVPAKARKLAKSKRSRKTTATINVVVTDAAQKQP